MPKPAPRYSRSLAAALRTFRQRLADERALLPLSLMGIVTGFVTGMVIQAFRFLVEWPAFLWFASGHEAFEQLEPLHRTALAVYGALSLGLFLQFVIKKVPSMGVAHVLQRVNEYHGRLPLRPAVMQFLLGGWCIMTGQSSGREGPAVHLGAAASSLLGQYWKLPSNSIRVLAGCGTAAAIAASFNTPIAGVIFAMEVVLMDYTIAGFIPIMLSAITGTVISHWVYGSAPAFAPPILEAHSLFELPVFIGLGLILGCAAATFCAIHKQCLRLDKIPLWLRFTIAGTVTGGLGYFYPQIMGIGYDTVNLALDNKLTLAVLLSVGFAKLIASATASGMGLPIGIIGPSLVCGACLGGAIGFIINYWQPATVANDSLYVMIGMGAMMGATMNAPLAALTALLELTNTPDIILPAMIAIVVANLVSTQVFHQQPPHLATLARSGKDSNLSVFALALQRVGISSLMQSNVTHCARQLLPTALDALIHEKRRWIVVESAGRPPVLLNGTQLAKGYHEMIDNDDEPQPDEDKPLDLLTIPGEQLKISSIDYQASALEAWQQMESDNVDALLISSTFDSYAPAISGIITRHDIETYYHRPRHF
ncbi:H(+)/Cl(-) exchange transporter ClcA [BD1-7 clade bacterium]|uniref:H(+)/Cl(-) exchange transporter ClcA n=1 Tax=BD1-7 clade bacterium TaxID=2029982 RepID=A0A5S9N6F9_9GAMM|nr:H(+)/Cl(-) exchange transporter ClcA [BD1-7 clade bacterium]CAA0085441.1 H(+)/Cl(-) exchange transporter ClcA [BD1-7 clade bacterium]